MDEELLAMILEEFFAENFPTERTVPFRQGAFGGDVNQSLLFNLFNALAERQGPETTREFEPESEAQLDSLLALLGIQDTPESPVSLGISERRPMFGPESQEAIRGFAQMFERQPAVRDVRDFEEQQDATMVAEEMFLDRLAFDQFINMMDRPGG